MTTSSKNSVVSIVVTYNRKALLVECLEALMNQSVYCDIVLVNNASTDGTEVYLSNNGFLDNDRIHYLCLDKNIGGAGGFYQGMKYALSQGWVWYWLMDDDANPKKLALEKLLDKAIDSNTVYGSAAFGIENSRKRLCWAVNSFENRKKTIKIEYLDLIKDVEYVDLIPFLGFFIHRDMINRIGLPDREFFIAGDDREYCERIKKEGGQLVLVKESEIIHPIPESSTFRIMNQAITYRNLPSWKIYYDVRNKIFIAKKYYKSLLWTQTIPGILIRLLINMIKEKNRFSIIYAYTKGVFDGFFNKTGQRFLPPQSLEKK